MTESTQAQAKQSVRGGANGARVAQIYEAIDNPQVQIVLVLRGSYGMSRLLPLMGMCHLAASKTIFVGHSDITALHLALLSRASSRCRISGNPYGYRIRYCNLPPSTIPMCASAARFGGQSGDVDAFDLHTVFAEDLRRNFVHRRYRRASLSD